MRYLGRRGGFCEVQPKGVGHRLESVRTPSSFLSKAFESLKGANISVVGFTGCRRVRAMAATTFKPDLDIESLHTPVGSEKLESILCGLSV